MDIKTSVFERVDCDKDHEHVKIGKKKCVTTWWYRIRYIDPETNKPKDLQRRAASKADAGDKADQLKNEIKETAGRSVGSERKTFADLCEYYKKHYAKPAKYVGQEKVSGLRSLYTVEKQIEMLEDYFGPRALRSITYGAIREFKDHRFDVPTRDGRQRSIASVHRELALLRRMLNVALEQGWLVGKNPFKNGGKLISPASEHKRERIITREEEIALLAACDAPKRSHLRAIIIAALDTGMRRGEILKLRWQDVDIHRNQIRLIAFNTKTAKPRTVPMPDRLRGEFERLWDESPKDPLMLVFGGLESVKKSFVGARRDAALPDVRFHDLRHTALTRIHRLGISIGEVAAIAGHTDPKTTQRYLNSDTETIDRAALLLNRFNAGMIQTSETGSELVN